MSDLPEGLCSHGVWMAPPSTEDCMECLADQLRQAGRSHVSERDRLREIIQTLYVNALRATEQGPLLDFMRAELGNILAGKSLNDAVRDYEAVRAKGAPNA